MFAPADSSTTRLRRARALVLWFDGHALVGFNFITRQHISLDLLSLTLLGRLNDWEPPEAAFDGYTGVWPSRTVADALLGLMRSGMVVVQGTETGESDERYEREWRWGAFAGFYHFGIRDPVYLPLEDVGTLLAQRAAVEPVTDLVLTNEGFSDVIVLPPPPRDAVVEVMRARRSWRGFDAEQAITAEQLSGCLHAGLGITGFVPQPIAGQPPLPLKMTPSGGARNPYEGYVYIARVDGVVPGLYHYSGVDGSLGLITSGPLPTIGAVLAGQPWFDGAAALILLVANFSRTIWKYPHPTGFRVVLLEAGHIAQNVLLAATSHGLAAAPTCAISDSTAAGILGLDPITQAAVYAIAIGRRSPIPTQADVVPVVL